MPDRDPADQPSPSAAARLQELAGLLRTTPHLEPAAQQELADLMDELAGVVGTTAAPAGETAHLADSAAHLAQALHQPHAGLMETARRRLEKSAAIAEAEAPLATGIVRRFLAALADLGI